MRIKFDAQLKDIDNQPIRKESNMIAVDDVSRAVLESIRAGTLDAFAKTIKDRAVRAETVMTVSDVSIQALMGNIKGDDALPVEKKIDLHELAVKIKKTPNESFSPEEVTLIRERIGKMFFQGIVGAVWPHLEGEADPKGKETQDENNEQKNS